MSTNDTITEALSLQSWNGPAILLVDLDAFFASVEQLDHPDWRGKPVIVGGDPDRHGVVSTCSYEARVFGVRSAMAASQARKLCPDAIWTGGHFDRYREMSRSVMEIIRSETPHVQQVSIDEAFVDISPTRINTEHPVAIAKRIQEGVEALGITCSIGVGTSKSVAKIASDMDKPQGLTVVFPGCEQAFLEELPVRILSGVGPAAERALHESGIFTLGSMAQASEKTLARIFGVNGEMMRSRALGQDSSEVTVDKTVKSVSHEVTFAEDLAAQEDIEAALMGLLAQVGRRMRLKGVLGRTLTLKVRYDDRTIHTAQLKLEAPSDDELLLYPLLCSLLPRLWVPGIKVRLLGVGLSDLTDAQPDQGMLFEPEDISREGREVKPMIDDAEKRRNLLAASDALKDRFGEDALRFGSEFKQAGNTTGSSSKNPADYG